MGIVLNSEKLTAVDTNTGEYLVCMPTHWQDDSLHFLIYSADGAPIFGADVIYDAVDETGAGGATLVHYKLKNAWFPTNKQEPPTYFFGETEMIEKLEAFLNVWRYRGGIKNPDPRFEFSDVRQTSEDQP